MLKLEVGGKYLDRSGREVEIVSRSKKEGYFYSVYPYVDTKGRCYNSYGRVPSCKGASERDLVEELQND